MVLLTLQLPSHLRTIFCVCCPTSVVLHCANLPLTTACKRTALFHMATCKDSSKEQMCNAACLRLTHLSWGESPRQIAEHFSHLPLLSAGMSRTAIKSCMIVREMATITFENTDKFYKPGIPYTGTVMRGSLHPAGLPRHPAAPSPAPSDPQSRSPTPALCPMAAAQPGASPHPSQCRCC